MRRITKSVWCCVLVLLFSGAVHGQTAGDGAPVVEPFTIPSARFSALGGNHAAAGDDFYAIFVNPASFVDINEEFSAAELSLTTYGPVLELADVFLSNTGSLENLDLSALLGGGGFAAGFDIAGPISFGWVGKGIGLGIFNRVKADAVVSGTKLRPGLSGEILLVGGYSVRIIDRDSHWVDGGFLGKGFFRGRLNLTTSILDALSIADDPFGKPFNTNLGLGLDLGLRYTFRGNFTASLVCFDVFSPVLVTPYNSMADFGDRKSPSGASTYATVARRLDFGIKLRIRNTFIDRYFTNVTVMADYRDILDLFSLVPRHPILNVGIGVEMTVLNALHFRFGMTDALPSFGFGLDLSFLTLDFAIFGKEVGIDPGRHSTYSLGLGVLFRY